LFINVSNVDTVLFNDMSFRLHGVLRCKVKSLYALVVVVDLFGVFVRRDEGLGGFELS
jgi:hypothetical protein